MNTILRISRAELRNLFYSPVAWFLCVVFMIFCAFLYNNVIYELARTQELGLKSVGFKGFELPLTTYILLKEGGLFVGAMSNLYLFLPLLTMGLLSREVNSGSIKLLYSSPIKTREIVFGKFLAMMIFNLVLVAIIAFFLVSAGFNIKDIDKGLLVSALIGFYLLVCAYAAIGLFLSSLSTYQIVSAIGTFVLIFVLSAIGNLWQNIDFVRDLTYFLSISGRTEKMLFGLVTTKDVLYFLIVIGMFLGFTLLKLRSVKETKPWYVTVGRYSGIVIVAVLIGYVSSRPGLIGYWDATDLKRNTIHPRVQKVVKELGDEPLEVTLYTNLFAMNSQIGLPKNRNKYLTYCWENYQRFKPSINFNYVYYYDLAPDSYLFKNYPGKTIHEIAKDYAQSMDLNMSLFKTPEQIHKMIDLSKENTMVVMQLKYKGKTTFLRTYMDHPWPGQEHVAASMMRLMREKMPTVLVTTGNLERDIEVMGERGYNHGTIHQYNRSALINNGFDVDTISLDKRDIPYDSTDIAALVLADPKTALSAVTKQKIQEYIERGGNFMALGEPRKDEILNPVLKPLGVELSKGVLVKVSKHNLPDELFPRITKAGANLAEEKNLLLFKNGDIDTLVSIAKSVAPVLVRDSGLFTVKPLSVTMPSTWLKKGVLVTDSVPPVLNAAEGDYKLDSFNIYVGLTRQINNKEQRILVSGDADILSNKLLGTFQGNFVSRALYSWLSQNEFPVYGPVPPHKDNLLLVTPDTATILKTTNIWIIPAIIALAGTIILIRRKRK